MVDKTGGCSVFLRGLRKLIAFQAVSTRTATPFFSLTILAARALLADSSTLSSFGDVNSDDVVDYIGATTGGGTLGIRLANTIESSEIGLLDLTTVKGARAALTTLKNTLGRISGELGAIGSVQSRLGAAFNTLDINRENVVAAASQITDADAATDASALVKQRILQQAAAAVLAQANQLPAMALTLLQGTTRGR